MNVGRCVVEVERHPRGSVGLEQSGQREDRKRTQHGTEPMAPTRAISSGFFESIPPEFRNGDLKTSAAFALEKLPDQAERIPAVRQVRELMGSTTYI